LRSRTSARLSLADVRNLARRSTQLFDAQQMTIVPGFIDCHNHAPGETLLYEVLVGDPVEVKFVTIDSIIDKLRKKASETPAGTWVEGYFFDDTKVLDKRQLNVHDLDKVSMQHPVVVHHRGGHTGFYNSKALQLALITPGTPNPAGGTFDHDDSGQLNGRVTDKAMDVFDKVPAKDVRPKITHCTLINDDLLRRIKALDAVPAPFNSYAYYNSDKFHFYGEELMRHCMAYRSFLDAGIHVAAGSDFDPGPFAPLMAIQGMVTRKGWNSEIWGANQRVSVTEALQINTLNGAYNSHEETIKGSISAGKLADFVVLAEDPHTVDPDKIKDIKIYRTVTGGATVYQV
jgi:predicted amidohydrolase YtcJ